MGRGPGAALAHHLAWQWTGFLRTTKTTYEIPGSWPQGFGCSSSDEICHSAHFCFSEDFKVIERISSASWQPGTLSAEPRKVLGERGCIHRPTYYCIEPTALSFPDSWKLWPFLLVKQHESVCMCLCVCVKFTGLATDSHSVYWALKDRDLGHVHQSLPSMENGILACEKGSPNFEKSVNKSWMDTE